MVRRSLKSAMVCLLLSIAGIAVAQEMKIAVGPDEALVPRPLLGLIHAPETHAELKLADEQVVGLESLFRDIDAEWFPARILPVDERRKAIEALERKALVWLEANASASQRERLRQLECYAQGGRCLLRDEIGNRIGLDPSQRAALAELARKTDDLQRRLSQAQFGDADLETLQSTLNESVSAERAWVSQALRPEQRRKLSAVLGPSFDPSGLKRIYPMAPQFAEAGIWLNSGPLTSSDLRDKVVLVHFYAFQCHNCHANFAIYRRWQKELSEKGVVVIGIQTPETSAERDVEKVRAAAIERRLDFPILVDPESKNWKAWGNTMWPTVYVVDKRGYIRHWWQGELNWKGATADETIEAVVDELLAER